MVPDVFISHALEDTEISGKVCEFMEQNGVRCWVAPRDIPPGDNPRESILRAILSCPVLVLVFSQSANSSELVWSEVDHAVKAGKLLIPFRIENVSPNAAIESFFRQRYWHEAHIPPLEQHLQELVRIIKPLIKKPDKKMAADASISRTLPSRSSIVRGSQQSQSRESEGPLRLFFNFNHVLVTGYVSTLEMILESRGTSVLENVEIRLESQGLKRDSTAIVSELAPGHSPSQVIEIEPKGSGHFVLQVTLKFRIGARQFAYFGTRTLQANEAPAITDPMSGIRGLMGNTSGPGAAGNNLDYLLATEKLPDLNELLKFTLPENFERLDLSLDYEVDLEAQELAGSSNPVQIPEVFVKQAQRGTILKLESKEKSDGGIDPEIRLVARSSFGLGRSREDSDFLLWFWPRNEIHDTKTRRISKKHCTLTVRGGKIYVGNSAAASLTTFDEQDVAGNEGVVLERRGILNLSGIYFLELTRFGSNASQGPAISNLQDWAGPARESMTPSPVSGSVRFVPKTSHVLPQNSTWLLSDGTFGSSRANPIIVELDGLAEIQGRFYHYLGNFWIETLVNNGAIEIDGHVLEAGDIVPLGGGQTVQLGGKSYHVTVES
jgi:hypothetical protein